MGLFDDIEEVTTVKIAARAEKQAIKKSLKTLHRNENCETLIRLAGGLPQNDEILNFVSDGSSDTGGFFTAILKEFGTIDEMYLSTWTISMQNVNRLLEAFDSRLVKEFSFLINDGLLKTNSTKAIWGAINEQFKARNIKFRAVNSHAKIFCVRCKDRFITVSGSGNWSENPRIENYFIIGGEQSFYFNKKWMLEQLNY
jgi:hypothetical protein